jgi:hypothetical protein
VLKHVVILTMREIRLQIVALFHPVLISGVPRGRVWGFNPPPPGSPGWWERGGGVPGGGEMTP